MNRNASNYFRLDNTEGYEQSELDQMNTELVAIMDEKGIDEEDPSYLGILKAEGDKIFNAHD